MYSYVILSSVLWTRTLDAIHLPHVSSHSTFIYRMNDQGLVVLSHNRTIVFSAIDFYRIPESFDDSKDYWIEQYGFNFRHCIYDTAWSMWHTLILITEYLPSPSLLLPYSLINLSTFIHVLETWNTMLSNGTSYGLEAYDFNTCIVTNIVVPNYKEY